jgi:hypothetical protein
MNRQTTYLEPLTPRAPSCPIHSSAHHTARKLCASFWGWFQWQHAILKVEAFASSYKFIDFPTCIRFVGRHVPISMAKKNT